MKLDGHIHIHEGRPDPSRLLERLNACGLDGGALISLPPASSGVAEPTVATPARLDNLSEWTEAPSLFGLYWIDPMEADAVNQVDVAVSRGVAGFKVICDTYDPGHERALTVFQAIADAGKPILFHSGILWDGTPSSIHNRPVNFEALISVKHLRFALAHIGWPWCDECIAVYGKLLNARGQRPDLSIEMFIDTTPGTPPVYREEALTRLFGCGYAVDQNVFFGTDGSAHDYGVDWFREWLERDRAILQKIGVSPEAIANMYGDNLRRFLGLIPSASDHKVPAPGVS